jgi:acylphosphatase
MSGTFERIIHVRVSGRVQKVGYRAWTEGQADARGLMGWVRNRQDGSVEAVFAGTAAAVAGMAQACWRGPTAAEVAVVDVQEVGDDMLGTASMAAFLTLPTA